ncbi:hypothetical protein [Amycolatopsis sp. RTGN1]|uniref:hypothetical protein n=1 Tax=Amycolatopsis ponsaeliensis TaxID=2992142 RepID=UPI00254EC091|nr:hypothetical protein [Amycolatopsis sp. RTGN1]
MLLFYAPLAAGLCFTTGNLWWLLWAFLIALVLTVVVGLSGHNRDWTARRRFREFSELADRIGARDGEVVHESRQRYNVIAFDPHLTVQTLRPGTEEAVRKVLFAQAAQAGFRGGSGWSMPSEDYRLGLHIGFLDDFHTGVRWEPVPDGHVVTEISIEAWKGGRPGDKPVVRRP